MVISSYPCVANVDISGRFVAVQILEDYTKALGALGIAFGTHTSTVRYGTSPFLRDFDGLYGYFIKVNDPFSIQLCQMTRAIHEMSNPAKEVETNDVLSKLFH